MSTHQAVRRLFDGCPGFMLDLHRLERGRRLVLLWDGLPAHRGRSLTDCIDDQRSWLSVERLPNYAP